jgi:hypothetical protein
MKTKTKPVLIAVSLALILFTFWTCKKATVSEPSPLGPSSIATILKLTASPNVLFAGLMDRQTTELTATLMQYNGSPFSDKTVFFEVVDSSGNRMDLGYFDGNLAMQSVVTDAGGTAQTHYHGPLTEEIADNGYVYIRATVAWDGSQIIADTTPLYVVRDSDEIVFKAEAIPDLIYAGETRALSEIRAVLTVGGAPTAGIPVYFVLTPDIGRFADGKRNTMALTNDQGIASVTYVGPLWVELPPTGATVNISVEVTQDLSKQLQIRIIRQR